MEDLCISCKKEPVHIKKRGLCKKCYGQARYEQNKNDRMGKSSQFADDVRVTTAVRHSSELEFVRNFFNHRNWLYEPAIFRANGFRYEPDFYDGERGVFIEVAGTKQAFSANREKYLKFIVGFPHLKFEVRNVKGHLIDINEGFRTEKKV